MLKEFKEFALKGNVVDLAVGVVIGAAFGKIVTSLVNDIIIAGSRFAAWQSGFFQLVHQFGQQRLCDSERSQRCGVATINYGLFLNTVIDFLIIAFSIFIVVKQVNRFRKKNEPEKPPVTTKECPFCISSIPIKATRCPQCTSPLTEIEAKAAQG